MSHEYPSRRVVLTGGGTAGHVMPNLALVPDLCSAGYDIHYIGSHGIEGNLVKNAGVPFHGILSGKLRRYASIENFIDVFKVLIGVVQAFFLLLRLRPHVVFSKGGFVAVPVAVAAWFLRIPVVSHESDYTPGLANRIIGRFARKLLYTFPETGRYIPASKGMQVPTPIREELFQGDAERGRAFCGFSSSLPVMLVMGGSQGAQRLNDALLAILPQLVMRFQVVHLTGKGKSIAFQHSHYRGFEFVGPELKDVFAATSIVVCRAGANSIFEMLALRIPMLLVPLEVGSRGDQVLNANSFVAQGWADVIRESTMTAPSLLTSIQALYEKRETIIAAQQRSEADHGNQKIIEILDQVV